MDCENQPRILIVDDSLLNLRIIEDVMKKYGYIPVTLSDGERVLEYALRKKPDLILLDIIMPRINGYEVCKLLKSNLKTKDIPIIFLTGQSAIEDIAKGFEVGAVDYIGKPFHEVELIARVRTHLQLKRLHDKLKSSNDELQKTNEELLRAHEIIEYKKLQTEFFANISHEFRTPLNVIFSTIQLFEFCMHEHMNIKNEKYIHIMKQNGYRLLRLVNNLIDITKIDSGYLEMDVDDYNIVNIVENIVMSISAYVERNGLDLVFDTDEEEKIIACDADKIERIILNLLSNAIKFTKSGGKIMVKVWGKEDQVFISVKDTGKGIPKDKIDTIFERFMQIDKSLSRRREGSGIGLSLVKALVQMHDGEICVNSTYGEGSEFVIKLPKTILNHEDTSEKGDESFQKHDYIENIHVEFSDIYSAS